MPVRATLACPPNAAPSDPATVPTTVGFEQLHALPESDPARTRLRDQLICANLPFAHRCARHFSGRGEPDDDLAQVAIIGLIKAIDRYDVTRGVPFESFAGPTIAGELKRHFRDKGWSIRVSRRMQELRIEINRAERDLTQRLGRRVEVSDLAEALQVDEDEIRAGIECAQAYSARSLNAPVGAEGDSVEFGDLLGGPDEQFDSLVDREALRQLVSELPERERQIVTLRFFGDLTQSQIAERVGISQMHVSRLLAATLGRLRRQLLAEPS